MGLDNGIYIKNFNTEEPIVAMEFIKERLNDGYTPGQVCYWRKHWGLRDEIVNKLRLKGANEIDGECEFKLDREEVHFIVKTIIRFMNPYEMDEEPISPIWDYEECMEWLPYDVIALTWLEEYMIQHPEAEVVFYDSW